jgi:hypothetical protein
MQRVSLLAGTSAMAVSIVAMGAFLFFIVYGPQVVVRTVMRILMVVAIQHCAVLLCEPFISNDDPNGRRRTLDRKLAASRVFGQSYFT